MKSVPITTKVVSSNPVHGEVYSIQHYVISLSVMTWDRLVADILQVLQFTDHQNITEIPLKLTLNTTNQSTTQFIFALSDVPYN